MIKQQKIVFSWLVIAIAIIAHNALEIGEALFFKTLPETPFAEGIPIPVHVINLSALVLPLLLGYLSLFYSSKGFKLFSFIYAILLVLLNIAHVGETIAENVSNLTQVAVLLFVAVVNIVLIILLNKWRKESKEI